MASKLKESYWLQPGTDCWLWQLFCDRDGYGKIGNKYKHGVSDYAHRVSWHEFVGPIPQGMQVLHICDRPSCINPEHLFLGNHTDNQKDAHAKGRHSSLHQPHKLSNDDLVEVRRLGGKLSHEKIAKRFGVSRRLIGRILDGSRRGAG